MIGLNSMMIPTLESTILTFQVLRVIECLKSRRLVRFCSPPFQRWVKNVPILEFRRNGAYILCTLCTVPTELQSLIYRKPTVETVGYKINRAYGSAYYQSFFYHFFMSASKYKLKSRTHLAAKSGFYGCTHGSFKIASQ